MSESRCRYCGRMSMFCSGMCIAAKSKEQQLEEWKRWFAARQPEPDAAAHEVSKEKP